MSQNLTTLLDLCNNASRGIWIEQRLSQRRGTTASQRRNAKQHGKGKDGSKLRDTVIQNITRLVKGFHGFASSWSLLNQGTKRCCVCRESVTIGLRKESISTVLKDRGRELGTEGHISAKTDRSHCASSTASDTEYASAVRVLRTTRLIVLLVQ